MGADGGAAAFIAARKRSLIRLLALRDRGERSLCSKVATFSSVASEREAGAADRLALAPFSILARTSASERAKAFASRPRVAKARESRATSFCKPCRKGSRSWASAAGGAAGAACAGVASPVLRLATRSTARGCAWLASWSAGARRSVSRPLMLAVAVSARTSAPFTTRQRPRFFRAPSQDLTDQTCNKAFFKYSGFKSNN